MQSPLDGFFKNFNFWYVPVHKKRTNMLVKILEVKVDKTFSNRFDKSLNDSYKNNV